MRPRAIQERTLGSSECAENRTRSIRNAKLATDAVNVTSAEVAPLYAFPEDAAAAAGQTEKQNAKPGAVGKYGVEEKGRAAAVWV